LAEEEEEPKRSPPSSSSSNKLAVILFREVAAAGGASGSAAAAVLVLGLDAAADVDAAFVSPPNRNPSSASPNSAANFCEERLLVSVAADDEDEAAVADALLADVELEADLDGTAGGSSSSKSPPENKSEAPKAFMPVLGFVEARDPAAPNPKLSCDVDEPNRSSKPLLLLAATGDAGAAADGEEAVSVGGFDPPAGLIGGASSKRLSSFESPKSEEKEERGASREPLPPKLLAEEEDEEEEEEEGAAVGGANSESTESMDSDLLRVDDPNRSEKESRFVVVLFLVVEELLLPNKE